jgi:hypothetical protein
MPESNGQPATRPMRTLSDVLNQIEELERDVAYHRRELDAAEIELARLFVIVAKALRDRPERAIVHTPLVYLADGHSIHRRTAVYSRDVPIDEGTNGEPDPAPSDSHPMFDRSNPLATTLDKRGWGSFSQEAS